MRDLFGEIRVVAGYDPDDEPGPFGVSFNWLKERVGCDPEKGIVWRIKDSDNYKALAGDLLPFYPSIDGLRFHLHHIV
jgi:hypothetical protein